MKYRHVSIYEIRGLIHPSGKGDVTVYTKTGIPSVTVLLTDNPDNYCYEIDRAQSVGYLMLTGSAGLKMSANLQLELQNHIGQIRERRRKELGTAQVLVFIAEGDVDVDFSGPIRDCGGYVVGFDIVSKEHISQSIDFERSAALAALSLSVEQNSLQTRRISKGSYLITESGKPAYSMSISLNAEAYSSKHTTDEIVERTAHYLSSLLGDISLSRVYRLFVQAISRKNDELRRFLFGWSALEILISKVFSDYEKLFITNLLGSDPANHVQRYFERVRDVMKRKYRITDKFVIVAACIGKDSVETDIEDFVKIKKARDALLHGDLVDEKTLPVSETISLLKRYIRYHTNTKAA